jgi:hypothetical protein
MLRVLDSMSFHKFIEERGPPFRPCDIFDEVYALIYDQLKRENELLTINNSTTVFEHIKELANQLLLNVKQKNSFFFFNQYFILGKSITTTNLYTKSTATITN